MNDLAHERGAAATAVNAASHDLAVIGAGSAGFAASIRASELGARVLLIGHGTIGGTCVNVGCIPSKTLIRAVEAVGRAHAAGRFAGVRAEAAVESWRDLVAGKDALVADLRRAKYTDLLAAYPSITYLEGRARLTAEGVSVDGAPVAARRIIVATGARPAVPPIEGIDAVPYLTSTTALALDALPKSLLVVGGGYIGCELAEMFARAGVRVAIACRSRLLPGAEPEISAALADCFRDEGVIVLAGATYRGIRAIATGAALDVGAGGERRTVEAERVLVASGRLANTDGMGLAETGVALAPDGAIVVDEFMRTTRPGVYAAGDATDRDRFVYMAAHGARVAAENALAGDRRRYDSRAMPRVTFTDPEVAGAGLTEAEARARGLSVKTSVLPLAQVPRAIAARDTRGLIKLVAEAGTGRLLGAHMLATGAADSIQTAALAIRQNLSAADLADMVFPYLTTVEGLKLAAQGFERDIALLSCCAG